MQHNPFQQASVPSCRKLHPARAPWDLDNVRRVRHRTEMWLKHSEQVVRATVLDFEWACGGGGGCGRRRLAAASDSLRNDATATDLLGQKRARSRGYGEC